MPPRQNRHTRLQRVIKIEEQSAPKVRQEFSKADFKVEELKKSALKNSLKSIRICNCAGDITKRWYVDYKIFDPIKNTVTRKRDYGQVNREKDPHKRYQLLLSLELSIKAKLSQGFSEYSPYSIGFYMQEYRQDKKEGLKKSSFKTTISTINYFSQYLKQERLLSLHPRSIKKELIRDFKTELQAKLKNRTVNNHLNFLRAFFNYLINNYDDVLYKNPCAGIDKLPSRSEKHVRYTTEMALAISAHLKEADPNLLNFIRFVGQGFFRPNEILNLKVGDIDFKNRTITLPASYAKTGKRSTKKLMNIFYDHLVQMGLENYSHDLYIFTHKGIPGKKKCYDKYFQRRFKKQVKKKFGLSTLHTLYGFRHTFVSELLHNGAPMHEIMKYTGHVTLEAFQKYAQGIIDLPAEDLSSFIKTKI